MPNSKDKVFKYMSHALCGIATIGFIIYCVYQYILDEDVSRIEFQQFNSEEDHIYPAITMCFPKPLLEDKLAPYGEGINTSSYSSFLKGELWDERMANINYDDVSMNIEEYLLGRYNSFLQTSFFN